MKFHKILLLSALLLNGTTVFAEQLPGKEIKLQINNKSVTVNNAQQEPLETAPYIKNDVTLVPIRFISESLDAKVDWNGETQQVTITNGSDKIVLTININEAYVNGSAKQLEVPPEVTNEKTMVPLRFVIESFNLTIRWNEIDKTITIASQSPVKENIVAEDPEKLKEEITEVILKELKYQEDKNVDGFLNAISKNHKSRDKDWLTYWNEIEFKYELQSVKVISQSENSLKVEKVVLYKKVNRTNSVVFDYINKMTFLSEYVKEDGQWKLLEGKVIESNYVK